MNDGRSIPDLQSVEGSGVGREQHAPGCSASLGHSPFVLCRWLLALASAALIPLFAAGAPAPTFHSGLKVASAAAALDQSLVLLIFGAEWCAPCQWLKKNTLESKEFLEGGGALRVAEVDLDANEKMARAFAVKIGRASCRERV